MAVPSSEALYYPMADVDSMSQNKVYQALKKIGSEGTTSDVRAQLKDEFPESTLPDYATNRLRQLEEKGVIEIDDSSTPYYVRIIDHEWEGIRESLSDRDFPPESVDNQ